MAVGVGIGTSGDLIVINVLSASPASGVHYGI